MKQDAPSPMRAAAIPSQINTFSIQDPAQLERSLPGRLITGLRRSDLMALATRMYIGVSRPGRRQDDLDKAVAILRSGVTSSGRHIKPG
jgi:hypothetical protein